jgi:RHS repeat-associated protein
VLVIRLPAGPAQSSEKPGNPTKSSPQMLEEYSYLHADQLGNIRAATGELNQRQATWSYDAYGTRRCTTTFQNGECGGLAVHFGYAGQYTDEESGLQYLRARYYDPATQQFMSRDPKEASTGQPYVYAYGSPLSFMDPAGTAAGPFQQNNLPPNSGQLPRVVVGQVLGGGESMLPTAGQLALPGFEDMLLSKGAKKGPRPTGGPHNETIERRVQELKRERDSDWEHVGGRSPKEEVIEEIAGIFGLKLDQHWNKERLPQLSIHPPDYHEFVLQGMRAAADIASKEPNRALAQRRFLQEFEVRVKQPVRENPLLLVPEGWGR